MNTEEFSESTEDLEDEFEIDSEASDDLESVMKEALEAVEKASSEPEPGAKVGGEDRSESLPGKGAEGSDVSQLEAEIEELKDRSVRIMADFDNFRKRVERERAEERRYAASDLLKEFLKVIDNLERAVLSEGGEGDFRTGVELILRQMHELLEKSSVTRIESEGKEFDPRYHEAVSKHESTEVAIPTVSDEMQSGYLLHDRLLRPSVVKVAMPSGGQENSPQSSNEELDK
jgi:molecular chaperone GrpE